MKRESDKVGINGSANQQLDRIFQERKLFRRWLVTQSRRVNHPLSHEEAKQIIQIAKQHGLTVRALPEDLRGDHWQYGPHIHVDNFHIPVAPGFQPS